MDEEAEECQFFKHIEGRPGLWHLAVQIFSLVDVETLIECDHVCESFRNILVSNEILARKIATEPYLSALFNFKFTDNDCSDEKHKNAKSFLTRLTSKWQVEKWKELDGSNVNVTHLTNRPVSYAQIPPSNPDQIVYAQGTELILAERQKLLTEDRKMAFVGHRLDISCLDIYESYCVTGSKDRQMILWDLKTTNASLSTRQRLASHDNVHQRLVTCVKFLHMPSTDGGAVFIVSTSRDRTLKLWNVVNLGCGGTDIQLQQTIGGPLQKPFTTQTHSKSIWGLDVCGLHVATASADGSLKVWRLPQCVYLCLDSGKLLTPSTSAGPSTTKEPKFKHVRDNKKRKRSGLQAKDEVDNSPSSKALEFCATFYNQTPVRHCKFLKKKDSESPQFLVSGDLLGDLNVWNVETGQLQYQVEDPMKARLVFVHFYM